MRPPSAYAGDVTSIAEGGGSVVVGGCVDVAVVVGGGSVAVVVVEEADTELLVELSSLAESLEQLARPIHAATTQTRRRR